MALVLGCHSGSGRSKTAAVFVSIVRLRSNKHHDEIRGSQVVRHRQVEMIPRGHECRQ